MSNSLNIIKTFTMEGMELKENMLEGAGNVTGIMDAGADVVFPGFFAPVLSQYLQDGFMPIGHNWNELPVAMPKTAKEVGNRLMCSFEFHSTDRAQEARTVCKERMERGLSVGLSVGFKVKPTGFKVFDSGDSLLEYASSFGISTALFDMKGIKAHDEWCRALLPGGCEKLYEVSIVPVPMNRQSTATATRSETAQQREVQQAYRENQERLDKMFPGRVAARVRARESEQQRVVALKLAWTIECNRRDTETIQRQFREREEAERIHHLRYRTG